MGHPRRRLVLLIGLIALVAAFGLLLFVFLPVPMCGCVTPGPPDWLYGQRIAHGELGVFTVEQAQIAADDLRIFYAFQSPRSSAPTVTVTSSVLAAPLSVRVQSLGQVGNINIGVVHTTHPDHVGQTLTLAISPPGSSQPPLHLTALTQQHSEHEHGRVVVDGGGTNEHGQPFVASQAQPLVDFNLIVTDRGTFGFFTISASDQIPSMTVYFRSDASVALVSQQEFYYGAELPTPTPTQ